MFEFPILLAPMAGVTDLPYRSLCAAMGCDLTCTEMVSAKGLFYGDANTARLLETAENERPCAVQLFGRDPALLSDMAKRLEDERGGEIACIDLNMGCPARKIVSNGDGCALMLESALAGKIVRAVSRAVKLPVSVKFRKGYDEAHENAVEFAKVLSDNGAAWLTVHGRTREQMYAGKADWDVIAAVKAAVHVPVVGNGDVYGGADALELKKTGCDGVMVARGAMGNPFIFREIKAAIAGEPYTPPTAAARLDMAMAHARAMVDWCGEHGAVEMRKHVAWYVRGMRGAAALRVRVNKCGTLEALLSLLRAYQEELEAG